MALKNFNENPRITDDILFEISTPDADGCFFSDPYKVDNVIIYHTERNFYSTQFGEVEIEERDPELEQALLKAEKIACEIPTEENIAIVNKLRALLDEKSKKGTISFNEAKPIEVFGTESFPAWLTTDTEDSILVKVEEDENGNPLFGHFTLTWSSGGKIREGNYFICWTWTPNPAGESFSAHFPFVVLGDPKAVITIPTHLTPEDKYITLLERYLPEMYKTTLLSGDLTPDVTQKLNEAVANGFTFIEDISNQLIDLFDANSLHESLLMYLSNLFNLKLKSNDPTLWRRQIKTAIPLYKKKGTRIGLEEAFANAGMKLTKLTNLWQVVSPCVFCESFIATDSITFTLTNQVVLPVDSNFSVEILKVGDTEFTVLSMDCLSFTSNPNACTDTVTWVGDQLSVNPVELEEGDIIKICYVYTPIESVTQQLINDYIMTLPLADQRDITTVTFLPKNWNVRFIEPDDPLFNILIPNRHPYYDFLTFGFIRTEFPYSENIYNMEEYNGSTRPSFDPCDLDKHFLDPCGGCLSSSYNIEIEIEEIGDDRIKEARDILDEYTPFHAQPFMIGFAGEMLDFVQPPVETIEILVTARRSDIVISGNANDAFFRVMEFGDSLKKILRDQLAEQISVVQDSGVAYNSTISLMSPDIDFIIAGISFNSNILEVLAPSLNSGTYILSNIRHRIADVSTPSEPLNQESFTFDAYNSLFSTSSSSVTQINIFNFSDSSVDFTRLGTISEYDTDNYSLGSPWKIKIPSISLTPYIIENILPDGSLILKDDGTLPVSGAISLVFELLTDIDELVTSGSNGKLSVARSGLVDLMDSSIKDVQNVFRLGDFALISGDLYPIIAFDDDPESFFVGDYTLGNMAGIPVDVRRKVITQQVGNFAYSGLRLDTSPRNLEIELGILNGVNGPTDENLITDNDLFKESFLIQINGDSFYKIEEIGGSTITLGGTHQDFMTLLAGGTVVNYEVFNFKKLPITIPAAISGGPPSSERVFDQINRYGNELITREIETAMPLMMASLQNDGANIQEAVVNESKVSFEIHYKNGKIERGEI